MSPEEICSRISSEFPKLVVSAQIDKGDAVVVAHVGAIHELMSALRDAPHFRFDMLTDLTAVDWFGKSPRFEVVYHLYSMTFNHRLRVKATVEEGHSVPSVTSLWKIADWYEREVWDMYGIKFEGHPNLKRLLMYEEFKGHPLRKDYPYDKRQPLVEDTWPVRDTQVQVKGLKIKRG